MKIIYANRIIERANWTKDRFTIDDVPERWKSDTISELANRGYAGYGNKLTYTD